MRAVLLVLPLPLNKVGGISHDGAPPCDVVMPALNRGLRADRAPKPPTDISTITSCDQLLHREPVYAYIARPGLPFPIPPLRSAASVLVLSCGPERWDDKLRSKEVGCALARPTLTRTAAAIPNWVRTIAFPHGRQRLSLFLAPRYLHVVCSGRLPQQVLVNSRTSARYNTWLWCNMWLLLYSCSAA